MTPVTFRRREKRLYHSSFCEASLFLEPGGLFLERSVLFLGPRALVRLLHARHRDAAASRVMIVVPSPGSKSLRETLFSCEGPGLRSLLTA